MLIFTYLFLDASWLDLSIPSGPNVKAELDFFIIWKFLGWTFIIEPIILWKTGKIAFQWLKYPGWNHRHLNEPLLYVEAVLRFPLFIIYFTRDFKVLSRQRVLLSQTTTRWRLARVMATLSLRCSARKPTWPTGRNTKSIYEHTGCGRIN